MVAGARRGRRLVVVGASFGGITAALTVKRLVPDVEIVLLERAPLFVFAPRVLRYLFGLLPHDAITRRYAALAPRGLRVLRTTAVAIERDRRRVVTTSGAVDYDVLLLATGLRLADEEVPGLAEAPDANLCPYDLGPPLAEVRRRIGAFRGGDVVVSMPADAYTCPPAPYEYALLWAWHLERRRLKGRVTVIDPRSRPTPPSLAPGLLAAMEARRDVLAYEPFTRLLSVDTAARTAETEAGRLRFDVLSVVPPNRIQPFLVAAGLGEVLVDVNPQTFRSPRDERVYALGDHADTPYAMTASSATLSGPIAGQYIAEAFGAKPREPGAPYNVCYPLVSPDRALRLGADWYFVRDETGKVQVRASGSADNEPKASNVHLRLDLEAGMLREMFGA